MQLLTKFAADVTVANDDGHTAVELAANPAVRQVLLESVSKGAPQRNLCQAAWQGDAMYLRQILVCYRRKATPSGKFGIQT